MLYPARFFHNLERKIGYERACLVRALMPQAVLWDIKFGSRTTKILIDEFFDIPLLLAKKKFFPEPPSWWCLTGGRGNPHLGGY